MIEAIEQGVVRPFKVEQQPNRLTHAGILKLFAAQVEDKALSGRNIPIGQLGLDYMALFQGWKVITRRPLFRRGLITEGVIARLEPLKRGVVIAVVFQTDFIKVVAPDVDRHIRAPIIRIALIDDAFAHIHVVQNIRPRTDKGL